MHDHPLIQVLQFISPLSAEAADAIIHITTVKTYPKGHQLLQLWQVDRYFHFINKGAGRVYYLKDGIDITDYIAMDKQFIGGLESLFTKQPSHKAIELLEQTELYSFLYDDFERLCIRFHEIERLGRKMATFAFLEAQRRIESIRFLTAAERYRELEKKYPGISNRIALKHIASYLGTTPVSISRIRSGIQ